MIRIQDGERAISIGANPVKVFANGNCKFDQAFLAATPEIRVPCPDENKFEVAADVAAYFKSRYDTLEVDGARVNFEHGWALVRPSNTNPYLSVRFEGKTEQDVAEMKRIVYAKLREYPSVSVPKG